MVESVHKGNNGQSIILEAFNLLKGTVLGYVATDFLNEDLHKMETYFDSN